MLNLSLRELKLIAVNRDIKGYESMSEDGLLSAPKESERNFDKTTIEEIKKKFNDSSINFLNQKQTRLEEIFMKKKTKKIFRHQE